jgi:hypothetical protein
LIGEHDVLNDLHLAALFQYEGAPCIYCKVSGADVIWTFRCPQFDAEAIREDLSNSEASVILSDFLKSLNAVSSLRNAARRSLEGMWRSERYTRA